MTDRYVRRPMPAESATNLGYELEHYRRPRSPWLLAACGCFVAAGLVVYALWRLNG